MTTSTRRTINDRILAGFLAMAAALFALPAADAAAPASAADALGPTSGRSAVSRQIERGGRSGTAGSAERHSYGSLQTSNDADSGAATASKPGGDSAKTASSDFWFYSADVQIFNDDDRDGYFHGIDLLFDADTYFDAADVYVVAYLSYEGGPWNEYAVTNDFTLNGATSDDEYVIVTELETGYPAGDYDLLIELYDAIDGSFLAEFGPADSSALSFLPLEDMQRDAPIVEEVVVIGHGGHGGGGAAFGLLPLAFMLLRRSPGRRRREPSA